MPQPNPRWQIVIALTIATAIHLSAVAIASLHRDPGPISPRLEFTIVGVDPGEPPPSAPEPEVSVRVTTESSPQEFIETEQPPRPVLKKQPIAPIRTAGQTSMATMVNPRAFTLYAPRPEYRYEARSRHLTGRGVARLKVNSATGAVDGVLMEQSIGSEILDVSAVSTFKRWRFKNGTPGKVRVPIIFDLTGPRY